MFKKKRGSGLIYFEFQGIYRDKTMANKSPMMIHKINPYYPLKIVVGHQFKEQTNQNSMIKVFKVVKPTNKKTQLDWELV